MNKNISLAVLAIVVIGLGTTALFGKKDQAIFDPLNTTYTFEGQQAVRLVNGKEEAELAPGSAEKMITKVFGEPVSGDLNGDGKADAALFLVQTTGGTGTFYYVAAAINKGGATGNAAQGTNAVFLGDRITPGNIEIKDGQIIASYADRKLGEPVAATPSVSMTKYLVYDGYLLQEAAPL